MATSQEVRQADGRAGERLWGGNRSGQSGSSRCEQGRRGTGTVRICMWRRGAWGRADPPGGSGWGRSSHHTRPRGGVLPPVLAHPPCQCPLSSSSRSWLSPSQLWDLEKPPLKDGGHGGVCPTGFLRGVEWASSARPAGCPEGL